MRSDPLFQSLPPPVRGLSSVARFGQLSQGTSLSRAVWRGGSRTSFVRLVKGRSGLSLYTTLLLISTDIKC